MKSSSNSGFLSLRGEEVRIASIVIPGLKILGISIFLLGPILYLGHTTTRESPGPVSTEYTESRRITTTQILPGDSSEVSIKPPPSRDHRESVIERAQSIALPWFPELKQIISIEARDLPASEFPGQLQTLHNSSDPVIRLAVVKSLAELEHEAVLPYLISALDDEESLVRIAAIEGLAMVDDKSIGYYLEPALFDSNRQVVIAATRALSDIESEYMVNAIAGLLSHQDRDIRLNAVNALGEIGGDLVKNYLLPMRRDSDAAIRANAAEIISDIDQDSN